MYRISFNKMKTKIKIRIMKKESRRIAGKRACASVKREKQRMQEMGRGSSERNTEDANNDKIESN